jgi:antitoxin YefM
MKTATVTEFRIRAKEFLEQVEKDQDILVISRPRGQEGFVVLTMSHYEALEETAHLLSTQANTEHLMQSIAQHKAGKVVKKSLIEPKRSPRKSISKK